MPEDGSTTPGSEGDLTPEGTPAGGGAPGDGASGDQNSEALRNLQAQRDRQAAEITRLKADLAAAKPAATQPSPAQAEPLSAEGVMALLKRDREMTSAVSQLKSEFTLADEAIFTGYDQFDSVEAFRAAAESSHGRIKGLVDAQVQPQLTAAVEAALKPYVEKYGRLAAPPAPAGEGTPTGLPSAEEVRRMSADQLSAFVAKHGEDTLNRLLYGGLNP